MASGKDRYANVLGDPLEPNWRILRWWKVTIRKHFKEGGSIDDDFLFTEESKAKKFKARAAEKYPRWNVWCGTVYVLSSNNGKTGHELPGYSPVRPRRTARLQQIWVPPQSL